MLEEKVILLNESLDMRISARVSVYVDYNYIQRHNLEEIGENALRTKQKKNTL